MFLLAIGRVLSPAGSTPKRKALLQGVERPLLNLTTDHFPV
jgi:hypothetical protein